jgi:hypothetical protein
MGKQPLYPHKPKKHTVLTIVCGWHEKYFGYKLIMGTKEGYGVEGETTSICPKCRAMFNKNKKGR